VARNAGWFDTRAQIKNEDIFFTVRFKKEAKQA